MADINLRRTFLGGLAPDENQTDIPHMVDFAHRGLPFNFLRENSSAPVGDKHRIVNMPECAAPGTEDEPECVAEHHYGSWFDSLVCIDMPPPHVIASQDTDFPINRIFEPEQCLADAKSHIESLIICPKPHSIGTGAHRVAVVFWLSGERYGIAFEEGGGPNEDVLRQVPSDNPLEYAVTLIATSVRNSKKEIVFIEGLTPGAKAHASDMGYVENVMIPSIVYAMTGYHLFAPAHDFVIEVYGIGLPHDDSRSTGHWFEGCRPSDKMYRY